IREINLKQGYGFVDLDSPRDAEDACYELNGKTLSGSRIVVEMSKPKRRYDDDHGRGRDRYDNRGGGYGGRRNDYGRGRGGGRPGGPYSTKYRCVIENLSHNLDWKDLKDMFTGTTYADAHKKRGGEGIIHFETYEDLKRAIKEYDGKEVEGKRIRLIDDTDREGRHRARSRSTRSRSHTRSPRKDRSRSRSPRKDRSRSRSPANNRSRSRSAESRD
uniref:RRM domain-containing protein n=1 Tax=Acrobeloides nanus TaxID=290746 RepID=A0A914CT55_9BILA